MTLRAFTVSLCLLAATGCRHRRAPILPQAAQAAVPLEKAPEPQTPPLVASMPAQPVPVPSITVPPPKPKRRKKIVPPAAQAPAPVQMAAVAPAEAIGSLTVGGSSAPETRRHAEDLLAQNERRLAALSTQAIEGNREQVARIRNFDHDARKSLDAGDAEGASTLATKAKLLLDDLAQ